VGVVCAAGAIFAPSLVRLMAPGFAAVPGKFELAVNMTRIMFPFLLLVAPRRASHGRAQRVGIASAFPAMASHFST
jgi:putative peptidoglycan lipid II flippase